MQIVRFEAESDKFLRSENAIVWLAGAVLCNQPRVPMIFRVAASIHQ
jgi:hypothetical protein